MISIRLLERALESSKIHAASCDERFFLDTLKDLEEEINKLQNKNKEVDTPYELY